MERKDTTHCNGCHGMTKSIRKGRCYCVCEECDYDKSLGDLYQAEMK